MATSIIRLLAQAHPNLSPSSDCIEHYFPHRQWNLDGDDSRMIENPVLS